MSKKKTAKAVQTTITNNAEHPHIATGKSNETAPDEAVFRNLRDRISSQLKTVEQKSGRNKRESRTDIASGSIAARGKKRSADGAIVDNTKRKIAESTSNRPTQSGSADSDEELKAALKELGGTEEDLDLIAGADSESEVEGRDGEPDIRQNVRKKGTALEEGMANILKEIAVIQGNQNYDLSDPEDKGTQAIARKTERVEENALLPNSLAQKADQPSKRNKFDARLKCEPRADWHTISAPHLEPEFEHRYTPTPQTIDQLYSHAKSLLAAENDAFKSTQQSSSSQAFYNTVIASGTLSDKISALTLAVQESPLHNTKALENLVTLAGKRSRAQAVDVLRALKDLLAQGALLPSDRRLYTFATQPALLALLGSIKSWNKGDKLPRGLHESDLISWAFEDWLKQQYFEVLKILEVWCNDEIEYAKGRAISYVYELLKEKPEQESNLLRLLVNKLGDPVKKIASQTSYSLMQLLSTHPAMKMVVISAIESDFIFRPGQSMHGIYYAAVTLNQTALSMREEEVAKKLLDIYFGLFTSLLKPANQEQDAESTVNPQTRGQRQRRIKRRTKTGENVQTEDLREKLISAVLTGVNRAYPYVGSDQKEFTNHLETLFKVTHSANFNTSIQAMLLIQQLASTHSASSDRFCRTLYESLLDPRLITASKQQLYLNLLHRSLKADMNTKRVKAFVKRLLQTLTLHDPSFICGVFFLLKDLERAYPSLTALVDQSEDHENDEEVFRDVDEDTGASDPKVNNTSLTQNQYDGYKRAPEHSNADNSCVWEVLPLLAHFHPSVTVSADHYMEHTKLPGKPDLTLHTLIHFLDRFVYRNPKLAANKLRGSSIMQPMASDDTHAVLISASTRQNVPAVNTDEFRNKKGIDVAAEDVFFHKYFQTLGKDTKTKKERARDVDDDASVGDEGEDAVWKAMMDSAPDLEGAESEDEDMDMSDFGDEMGSDDDLAQGGSIDSDGEGDVDIEAGIFDDSDDETDVDTLPAVEGSVQESEFEGLDSDVEVSDPKKAKLKDKRKAEREQRKKMKALPTFASAADYAKMLDDEEDEDLG